MNNIHISTQAHRTNDNFVLLHKGLYRNVSFGKYLYIKIVKDGQELFLFV